MIVHPGFFVSGRIEVNGYIVRLDRLILYTVYNLKYTFKTILFSYNHITYLIMKELQGCIEVA